MDNYLASLGITLYVLLGKLSFVSSTVSLGKKLLTPDIQALTGTFVRGVPGGVSSITHTDGQTEKVFIKHGVPVGLGVNKLNQTVVTYGHGSRAHPVWRFVVGADVVSMELEEESVVFVRVSGVERMLVVRQGVGYEVKSVQWSCDQGLLRPGYEVGGKEKKYKMVKNFPQTIDEQDQIVYQAMKVYIDRFI